MIGTYYREIEVIKLKIYLVSRHSYPDHDIRLVTMDVDKAINMLLHDPEILADVIDVWKNEEWIASYGYYIKDNIQTFDGIKRILEYRESNKNSG